MARAHTIEQANDYGSVPFEKLGWFYGFDDIEQSTELFPTRESCQRAIDDGSADWHYTHGI